MDLPDAETPEAEGRRHSGFRPGPDRYALGLEAILVTLIALGVMAHRRAGATVVPVIHQTP